MTILGLDIFSTNGELLTSVDGDTFTMLDEDVVVKVYAGGNDRTCKITSTPRPVSRIFKDVDKTTPHYSAFKWAKNKGLF